MALDDFARRVGKLHDHAHERSQTARLNAYFPVIEQALNNGLSLASILRELQAEGFTFRITGLKSALYRIRKKRTATATTASKAAKSNSASTVNGALTNSLKLMLPKSQHPYAGSGSSPQGLVASITSQ